MKTRMLKCQCGICAHAIYSTRKWLIRDGAPLCPAHDCPQYQQPMECIWLEEQIEAARAEADVARTATIRDKWVKLRKSRECDGCGGYCPIGEECRYRAYSVGGELFTSYHCQGCESRTAHRDRQFRMARN